MTLDPIRFDAFVRALTMAGGRRAALKITVGAIAALGASRHLDTTVAEAARRKRDTKEFRPDTGAEKRRKKKCKPPCSECQACVKKVCQAAADGTACDGGTCAGGTCVNNEGNCAIENDGSMRSTVRGEFDGQPLGLEQRFSPAEGSARISVTLGGGIVLLLDTELVAGRSVTTVTYGPAFAGVKRARFTTDGGTLEGEIDGRVIRPMPVGSPIADLEFADGGPPPDVQVDPGLVQAIQELFDGAGVQAGSCSAIQAAGRGVDRTLSVDCLLDLAECGPEMSVCLSAVAGVGATVCGILTFGLCAPIAAAAGTAYCFYECAMCARQTQFGPECCPVRCGGNVDDLLGANPMCCEQGEDCGYVSSGVGVCCPPGETVCAGISCCAAGKTCQPNGACCSQGSSLCGDTCCENGKCQDGVCCQFPDVLCGEACCAPLSPCCAGKCCTGICTNGVCCVAPARYCNGSCCANNCCNGVCCAAGESCGVNGRCEQICNTGQLGDQYACPNFPGNPQCCRNGHECCPNVGCCGFGLQCCSGGNGRNFCASNCLG